jgi:hypothetical protein
MCTPQLYTTQQCTHDTALCCYDTAVQEVFLKIYGLYARGVIPYFYFSREPPARALKIRQINSAILKVPDGAWIR